MMMIVNDDNNNNPNGNIHRLLKSALSIIIGFVMLICQPDFTINVLHLALFYEPIDLWLAFYITIDYVTVRPSIKAQG
jgi:hypothetical protein